MGLEKLSSDDLRIQIISLVAVLKESCSSKLISKWVKEDPQKVEGILNEWKDFLQIELVDGEPRYSLYHSSFQEFLNTLYSLTSYDEMIANFYIDVLFSEKDNNEF